MQRMNRSLYKRYNRTETMNLCVVFKGPAAVSVFYLEVNDCIIADLWIRFEKTDAFLL